MSLLTSSFQTFQTFHCLLSFFAVSYFRTHRLFKNHYCRKTALRCATNENCTVGNLGYQLLALEITESIKKLNLIIIKGIDSKTLRFFKNIKLSKTKKSESMALNLDNGLFYIIYLPNAFPHIFNVLSTPIAVRTMVVLTAIL